MLMQNVHDSLTHQTSTVRPCQAEAYCVQPLLSPPDVCAPENQQHIIVQINIEFVQQVV